MIRSLRRWSLAVSVVAAAHAQPAINSSTTSPLWGGLEGGRYSVGFRIVDTIDVTRSFADTSGQNGPRPMRLYMWYPAAARSGVRLVLRDLVREASPYGGVMQATDSRAFARALVRARSGAAFSSLSDAAADSLLAAPLFARSNASPTRGRFPVVLLAPGQPLTMPITAEFLASHGVLVVGMARKGDRTFESLAFTPNAASIDAEAGDLAFALGVVRQRRDADASRLALIGYSSSNLSNLAFAFRSHAPQAIVAFEGWEGWEAGTALVRTLPSYDPRGFRTAYLLLEKSASEPAPGFAKTSAFFDAMQYAPRWRIAFDSAAHTDFASFAVALPRAPAELTRTFVRAHQVLLDFLATRLAPGSHTAWQPPRSDSGMRVTSYAVRASVPSDEEFFHLAELDPLAAETLAARLASASEPIVPFSEASLSRLALLASSRRPADAAILYRIVIGAFPRSTSAAVGLSDALESAGRHDEAAAAARAALDLVANDSNLGASEKDALRRRLEARLARANPFPYPSVYP